MRVPTGVLRVTLMVPALLVSVLLWLMVLVVLPPTLGLLGFLGGGTLLTVLAAGGLEGPAVRLLTRSREATAAERAVLAPVLDAHGGTGLPRLAVYVRRAAGAAPPALAFCGSSLVVTPWLVEATYRGWISRAEATAIIVHADARQRAFRRPSRWRSWRSPHRGARSWRSPAGWAGSSAGSRWRASPGRSAASSARWPWCSR
ncbi:MAG TPA: hypothetical protein VF062_24935 [Candidatus Limnocylindrales bacterium]